MMHLSIKDSGTLGVLTLHGKLTGHCAEELHDQLSRCLNRVKLKRMIVNCEQVTALDMNCIKLLCTAYRVSQILKKELFLAGDRTTFFRQALGATEFTRCEGVHQQCGTACLWTDQNTGQWRINEGTLSTSAHETEI